MPVITATKQISSDCVQITLSTGSCFFIRLSFLCHLDSAQLVVNRELLPQELEDLIESGLVYSAEKAASAYLNRSEHSRFLLQKKLVAKGFDVAHITKALDFLEQKGFLSDLRYAVAWVRNRSIHHVEGRSRLLMELTSRGINRKIAEQVVDEHFETVDQNAFFEKVAGKCRRLGKTGLAAEKYLQRKGFTFAQIKKIISIL